MKSSSEAEVVLHVRVTDTGIGIPPDRLEHVFVEFEQADGSTSRKYGGTGLGLSISTKLVEMMQGEIWVNSEVGRGSTFHFTARLGLETDAAKDPSADAGRSAHAGASRPHVQNCRILVADDNHVNLALAKAVLGKNGHQVTCVYNGREAVERAMSDRYDLVLMDGQMPVVDGLEATRLIREQEQQARRHTPIIAMTAHAMKGDRQKCLDAGMDGYVSKPYRQETLFAEIDRVLQDKSQQPPQADESSRLSPATTGSSRKADANDADHAEHDWEAALIHTGGDRQMMAQMIDMFLAEARQTAVCPAAAKRRIGRCRDAAPSDEARAIRLSGRAGDKYISLESASSQLPLPCAW